MSLARTHSIALVGVQGHPVEIEADIENGLVGLMLVGLPDTALREARDRIRAAIVNSSEKWPNRRITVGLSPASLPKRGSSFDLGIAIAILAADGAVPPARISGLMFLGELGLDGRLRPVRGVLPGVAAAAAAGFGAVAVPAENAPEACLVPGMRVLAAPSLGALLEWLRCQDPVPGRDNEAVAVFEGGAAPESLPRCSGPGAGTGRDLADVVGQPTARRAAEVCAAGGHNLFLLGPPGVGKTMLAECLPTILPRLDIDAALEVSAIHSVAGTLPSGCPLLTEPPFCAPHHTSTRAAIVGGGTGALHLGAASLAHHGCLFLDEARNALRIHGRVQSTRDDARSRSVCAGQGAVRSAETRGLNPGRAESEGYVFIDVRSAANRPRARDALGSQHWQTVDDPRRSRRRCDRQTPYRR
jgi:magnesium chelatase family protein